MGSETTSGPPYEVERSARHAERPGFRINELQIGLSQEVPWHYHTKIRDTFYVLQGRVRIHLHAPEGEVCLGRARPQRWRLAGRTGSPTQGKDRRSS